MLNFFKAVSRTNDWF